MDLRDKYLKLVEMLDSNPVGAPNSKEFMEMMEIFFPEEHLDLALLLSFKNQTLEEVAQAASRPKEEVEKILEEMAARGTILSKASGDARKYRLWPIYAGLFEYTSMSGKFDDATRERLYQLWHHYYKKTLLHEVGETNPPWKRVLPAMESYMQPDEVLPYEIAADLIRTQAKRIALGVCACRDIEKKCDKPIDTCLAFDEAAGFMIEYNLGKEITVDEAIGVLKRAEEAGLVHMSSNNKNNLLFMCNCCSDCCHLFRPYTEFNYPDTVGKSSVLADISADLCTGCGICSEKRCPVKAIKLVDGLAVVNDDLCIGCGLCVTTCPTKAISLAKKPEIPNVPETLGELSKIIGKTKKENRADPRYVR